MLLVTYSASVCRELEAMLKREGASVLAVDGRAPNAAEVVRGSGASLVVLDSSARDVDVAQTIRQLGQLLPESTVLAVFPGKEPVGVYRCGRKVSEAVNLSAAIQSKPAGPQGPARHMQQELGHE